MKYLLKIGIGIPLLLLCLIAPVSAQTKDPVAENMLMYQRADGGWTKSWSKFRIDYNKQLTEEEKDNVQKEVRANNFASTIDNDATYKEINYLVKAFKQTGNKAYLSAVETGIQYLLDAQYANGGWPQFYPLKKGYYTHITYNDNAMIHAMNLLNHIAKGEEGFDVVDKKFISRSAKAVEKGIDCILKTQVRVNGKLTAWCAQHDEFTFQPAKARSWELVSLSGLESVPLVQFLMRIKNPSPEIIASVKAAVAWFEEVKMTGYDFVTVKDSTQEKGIEKYLAKDAKSTIWARFYELETNQPFVCGKDGIAKKNVSEIDHERRVGYLWYGRWPESLLKEKYPAWLKTISTSN